MDGSGPRGEAALSASVLVLNRNYQAIRIISARRAFVLMYRDRAEAIEQYDGQYLSLGFQGWVEHSDERFLAPGEHEIFVRTPKRSILVPRVIRLVRYDKLPRTEVKYSRRNVLARDDHHCQYCGKRFPVSRLSIDHVLPKSRGGASSWTNVVTACNECNTRKGGRLPNEAHMRLMREPRSPRRNPFVLTKLDSERYLIWRDFLREGDWALDA